MEEKQKHLTKEQREAEAKLEKTLDTLSEEELDILSGGKVTDDVKKFFQSEKGKEVLKYTAIIGAPVVTLTTAVAITAGVIYHKTRPWKKNPDHEAEGYEPLGSSTYQYEDSEVEKVWNGYIPPTMNDGDDSEQI